MKRREFIANSLATTTLLSFGGATACAADKPSAGRQEYYELRTYRLKGQEQQALLENYLGNALIPALNRLGSKPVGVFVEKEPKPEPSVFVLIPFATADAFAAVAARLSGDADYQKAGAEYLQVAKANPAFQRIDSWLMLAFAGQPQLRLPVYCTDKKPRMFELRTYESYSEVKALKKIDMFNSGEIETMHEVGLAPIFYGQALIGPNLPHLSYMTSGENEELHKKHWDAFGKHPVWVKLKDDPQYADTVSKITKWFLVPTNSSQI